MNISVCPLLKDLRTQSETLTSSKKELKQLENQATLLQNLKKQISQELEVKKSLDWSEGKKRDLLDRLYELDSFQFHERIYAFKHPNEAQPLLKDIDAISLEQHEKLYRLREVTEKKHSQLEAYQQQILNIIQKLSQCISCFNR